MLLMIEALLFILAALGQEHRPAFEVLKLDMAPNSVDDQYKGCTEEMAHLVETKYLQKEMSDSREFKIAWEEGENATLEKKHSVAIHVYTGENVYSDFNKADRNDKKKYIDMTYKWYSLHFLLTEAIQILKKQQNTCYDTYRGTKETFNEDVLNKEVRFGSFTSSSLDIEVAEEFGSKSCFEIHTCEGADITKYSQFDEKEVLIPPYEKFNVTEVKTRRDQTDLWCETVFVLNSTGKKSDLNCTVSSKKPNILQKIAKTFCCNLG